MFYSVFVLLGFGRKLRSRATNSLENVPARSQSERAIGWGCTHLQLRIGTGREWGSSGVEAARHSFDPGCADDTRIDHSICHTMS